MSDYIEDDDAYADETEGEREARRATQVILSEQTQAWVDNLVDKLVIVCNAIMPEEEELRPYQLPLVRRIFESLIISDGETVTALCSRQSGKTEAVGSALATAMIMLPVLARVYPDSSLAKYRRGVWVGAFAPVDGQADILHARITARLSSEAARAIMSDPEINDRVQGKGKRVWLSRSNSRAVKITCHPRATIEGDTFHVILVDECQGADDEVIKKSVSPMGASTRATRIYTGTPARNRNIFYTTIQDNKRRQLRRGRVRQNHFQWNWKEVAKHVPDYAKAVQDDMIKMGEDSDEFRMSYLCEWLLDKGMFTTEEKLDQLGDIKMQELVKDWTATPVVVGIDCARIKDRTIVTVVFVDWNNPDAAGFVEHRVINWLDLEGQDWETQYFRIQEFLSHYKIYKVGVDGGGLGDVVIDRLRNLMPRVEFVSMSDAPAEQSKRWKYLKELMDRHQLVFPFGSRVRRLRTWRRFHQEMVDLEIEYKKANLRAFAPDTDDAHDDYPDSLAMACFLTKADEEHGDDVVTVYDNFLFQRPSRYR